MIHPALRRPVIGSYPILSLKTSTLYPLKNNIFKRINDPQSNL
nr:MAG TPA: hypothetical protein [Caudoviricetes sp.]